MLPDNRIDRTFLARSACEVARALLGKLLVRSINDVLLKGIIVETEAYCDGDKRDLACHGDRSNNGRPTKRTKVMFGPAGFAYVYFTYGMHWMFNIVTGIDGQANAVLIRAIEPIEGLSIMTRNRKERPITQLTNGPAKLTQALGIDKSIDSTDLCKPDSVIWVEQDCGAPEMIISSGPRIGLGKTPEPWLSIPWRFWIEENPYVSR